MTASRRQGVPVATYRVQLGPAFGFDQLADVLPYLASLGISHVYVSPFLAARPGSTHGYDVVDFSTLNPEIGDGAAFDRLCDTLRSLDMGMVLDFVPNHMAIAQARNRWWDDVLQWGRSSPYAAFFDIQWETQNRALIGKVLLPFLGDHYGRVLERGELQLVFERETGQFVVRYFEHRFPIRPRHSALVIDRAYVELSGPEFADAAERLRSLTAGFAKLRPEEQSRRRQIELWCAGHRLQRLLRRAARDERIGLFLERAAALYAGTPGQESSFRSLHRLLDRQAWRLSYWRVAADEINYRRFFEIDELAGLRQETPELFRRCHRLAMRFLREERLQGLRIDHIDGLGDPAGYLAALRHMIDDARLPSSPYIVVEKILEPGEVLPKSWAAAGTTGYDFLSLIDRLFVLPDSESAIDRAYRQFTGDDVPFDRQLVECKRLMMDTTLASHLTILAQALDLLSEQHWRTRDYSFARLRLALRETIAHLPIYRTYVTGERASPADRQTIERAIAAAAHRWRGPDHEIFAFVAAALTGELLVRHSGYDRRDAQRFIRRFQQYTGPVMAKALEDTGFYRYVRLLSLNDVGGDPRVYAIDAEAFHASNRDRLTDWPDAMLATATHDTKRGEDARQRISVLSEIAQDWVEAAERWSRWNRSDDRTPSAADEYLLYQSLVGAWPADPTPAAIDDLRERLKAYVVKAAREAKVATSWINHDETYETGCQEFVDRILSPGGGGPFLDDFARFMRRVAFCGALGSLSRTVLKLTVPGMPDVYEGTELWDLSLVDPDNRRPVDFSRRRELLHDGALSLGRWQDGAIKLKVTTRLLRLRNRLRDVFRRGDYVPLATGNRHVVAFARRSDDACVIVAVGRFFALLGCGETTTPDLWKDAGVTIEGVPRGRYVDALTERSVDVADGQLPVASLFTDLPAIVLVLGN